MRQNPRSIFLQHVRQQQFGIGAVSITVRTEAQMLRSISKKFGDRGHGSRRLCFGLQLLGLIVRDQRIHNRLEPAFHHQSS